MFKFFYKLKTRIRPGTKILSSKENSKLLIEAAYIQNYAGVLAALETDADVNIVDRDGRTPLTHAVTDKEFEIVKLLCERGADVKAKDSSDWTALHFAAQNYDLDMCKYLVDAGAEVDAVDGNGNTALMRAEFESRGSTDLQDFFISVGANFELKNFHGVSTKDLRNSM
ncbi:MAG: hypothetical protein GKS00_15165 [Alphaproteobacteria bacterium]|nr:hypothetical protein [Alphaproteobacteria bacterium]